jgi:hypothetical protein
VAEIDIGEVLVFIFLGEGVRYWQRLCAAKFLNSGKPLLLMHGIARDQERQHVLHPKIVGHVVKANRERASGAFGGDVCIHVCRNIAGSVDMGSVERHTVGIRRKGGETCRQNVPHVHAVEHGAPEGVIRHVFL